MSILISIPSIPLSALIFLSQHLYYRLFNTVIILSLIRVCTVCYSIGIRVCTVCYSINTFLMKFRKVWCLCSNFRKITAKFSGIQKFRNFTVCSYYRYTPEEYPVLAFTGAPARFPVEQHHTSHQKYLQWSDNIVSKVDKFIEENIGTEKYLGIHLRLGSDFVSNGFVLIYRKI